MPCNNFTVFSKKSKEKCRQFTMKESMQQIEEDFHSQPTTIREHPLHKYGEDILITIPYVVCLKGIGYKIINKSWYENTQKLPEKEEKRVLVEAAAAVIVEDIRSQVYNLTEYPSP